MAKKALCLSGGASRGSFQIGAIKCLYEVYGFRPDIIAGTSVGSINGIKLACAPPPASNDAKAILAAVSSGNIDDQLIHMRELEQFWFGFQERGHFFTVKPVFIGTIIEEFLKETKESDPQSIPIGTQIDTISALINIPLLHLLAAPYAVSELQKIKTLIENIEVENAIATLTPVENKLKDPNNINMGSASDMPPYRNNLFNGTPLYLAMVALETGKLRYATNKGEFYERDGVTPVLTALMDSDIDMALDENLQPLAESRKNNIKFLVSKYKAAVNQMAVYHAESNISNTTKERKKQLLAAFERERERGNFYSRALKQQIQGVKVKVSISPVTAAVGSSCLPGLLESQVVGVERYIDAGLREIIPVEIVLNQNVTEIVGILCSTVELPETDSMENVGLLAVGARAAMQIEISEITLGDMATANLKDIDTHFIMPFIDVHDGLDVKPSLIEISMHYGWMRTADEMQPVTAAEERKIFRQSSELITRLRLKCLELEKLVATNDLRIVAGQKWEYFELRVNRWAIMHVASKRTALGLPQHPGQAMWSTDWEREFRGSPPFQFSSVWTTLEAHSINSQFQADLWSASSPVAFNPDIGSIEDAGSDRIYWMVRGAIFEDNSGSPLSAPLANVVMPSGLHQFLPRIPVGRHLMAETQDQSIVWLVFGGKKFASPTPQLITAAGLTGTKVAIVPQGGLDQIPDGGIPYFLGSLCVVDANDVTLFEVIIDKVEQSNSIVDISIHNRSTNPLTNISVVLTGFSPDQGISVENVPNNVPPNTIDFFTLHLHPTTVGEFNGSLLLNSSDTLFPTVKVGLKLKVLPLGDLANLEFMPTPLEINARVNSTSSYSMLTITNTGGISPDTISATIEPAEVQSLFCLGIHLSENAFTPGKAVQVPVFFNPTAVGRFTGELVLMVGGNTSTNNPYTRTVRIPLTGNAGASTIGLLSRMPIPRDFQPLTLGDLLDPMHRLDIPRTSLRISTGTIQTPINGVATFFILNLGNLPLEISTMLGYYSSVIPNQQFPIIVDPRNWVEVALDFGMYRFPGIGAFTETIRVLSNDPVTQEATVVLEGIVGGVKGSIVPEFIDFSMVPVNVSLRKTTTFQNLGTVDLHVNKMAWQSGNDFRLGQSPALPYLIPAGGSLTLDIDFGPVTTEGFYGDSFRLNTSEGIVASLGVQAKTYT